jgi:hypothetical protein
MSYGTVGAYEHTVYIRSGLHAPAK